MILLILGIVLFFGAHMIRVVAPSLRAQQIAANERRWKGLYALVSLLGFVLLIWGYASWRAEAPQLYLPPEWGKHVTFLFVLIGLVLYIAANLPPGLIRSRLQHPMLIGTIFWGVGHLLANGDAAGVLLFGSFAVYGVWNLVAQLRRDQPKVVFKSYRGDIIAVVAGVVVYAVILFWLHPILFGANPLA